MKIVDVADELYRELGRPSTISIPAIAYWLRTNLGILNNYINTLFYVKEDSLEIVHKLDGIVTNIGIDETAILKKMYTVYYYETLVRTNISNAESDTVISVNSDGMGVRKTSKTAIGQNLISIKKQEWQELQLMVNYYKSNKAIPRQVAGGDTTAGIYPNGQIGNARVDNRNISYGSNG